MRQKPRVTIVYNEPGVASGAGRKFVSPTGILQEGTDERLGRTEIVDVSELGVLEEVDNVHASLKELGYGVAIFNVADNLSELVAFLEKEKPDLVFNLCESLGNVPIHEMHVAGIFELLGLCYTGSRPLTLGLALNKIRVKEILSYHGINSPKFLVYYNLAEVVEDDFSLHFPVIVKPSNEDASTGIEANSVVESFVTLKKRVRSVFQQYDQPALVEEFIDGRELNVSIIGNRRPTILPISEIDFSTLPPDLPRILTYGGKWLKGTVAYNGTKGVCPAVLPPSVETKLKETALRVFRLLECRDYARVDFRLSRGNVLFVLEVNPNPDISDDAGFARSAKASGRTYTQVLQKIIEYALERSC
ncbi:MAG: ATP-grasp domain-containing protein [Bacteroidota bacterium]